MNRQGAIVNEKSFKMRAKSILLAAAMAVATGGLAHAADMAVKSPKPAPTVPFFFVNDTSVSFTYYFSATDPGVSGSSGSVIGGIPNTGNRIGRYSGEIDHFDVWEYGTNLIHVEFNQYGNNDPSLGIVGAQGAREFFGFARSTFGINELTHSKIASSWLFKDIGFEIGGNAGVEDNFLDEHTTQGVFGLNFDVNLNLPGTILVGILAYKEFTRNEFNGCGTAGFGAVGGPLGLACAGGGAFSGERDFEWTWKLESFVAEPLTFLPWPVSFINIANVTGPKGTGISTANCLAIGCFGAIGGFNNNESKTEVFEDARLTLDTSKVFWGKPGIWDTYVGYRYWYNKFGTNHNAALFAGCAACLGGGPGGAPGTSIESTAYVGTTYHFK
jgi:hypothetical protein